MHLFNKLFITVELFYFLKLYFSHQCLLTHDQNWHAIAFKYDLKIT